MRISSQKKKKKNINRMNLFIYFIEIIIRFF